MKGSVQADAVEIVPSEGKQTRPVIKVSSLTGRLTAGRDLVEQKELLLVLFKKLSDEMNSSITELTKSTNLQGIEDCNKRVQKIQQAQSEITNRIICLEKQMLKIQLDPVVVQC